MTTDPQIKEKSVVRRVVFVGNCQLYTLANLYRRVAGSESDDNIAYVPSYQDADAGQRRIIAEADVLVQQVLDFAPRIGDLPTRATVHLVPHIAGAFLWPYTGQPHPKNAPAPFLDEGGPYPIELGDSFLNRMIVAGVPAEQAVPSYLSTDVAAVRRVDRLQELVLDKQRDRDLACGYGFADLISSRFRQERLFRSPNHPEVRLTMMLAGEVFARLGMAPQLIEAMVRSPPGALFPPSETPIHPSIIEHFGLECIAPDTRYRYFNEGSFTFEEFAYRYMRYEWNPDMAKAFHLFWAKQFEAAAPVFEVAVRSSPRSAAAHFVLSDLLARQGRFADAVEPARQAVRIEPANEAFRKRLDYMIAKSKQPPH